MGNPRMLVFFFIAFITVAQSLPFVVLHGIGDKCKHQGIYHFIELLSDWSESQGYCIEIGNGSWDSWTMPLTKQTAIACEQIKKISDLRQGYNIVGFSQGNLIARGIIEFCDRGPPVKNFVSLGGPHAGTASTPLCGSESVCKVVDAIIKLEVYSGFVQAHVAPSGYVKIPTDMADYLSGCKFLPKLNNEIASERNSTYKDRFSSLQNLVLIMFENDTIIIPKETAWFGYYPDGAFHPVLAPQQTKLYTEDWIGLRTLDEAGKVKFISVSGDHLRISESDIKTYIVPYLKDHISMVTTYNTKNRRTLI
ncbi:PREDICTED: palmitoyl-protein thioesterase 1-like isoform X1 [Lupinus angustifolius]|uniref:palmitoyl-protein thioesterase 1-like isoform X1 n=1 Tax=Lupinus angustifolius TaxID=3871 RepID=UPI00092FB010|nr:PREDICTED: palmitoyl-protein thioesterase 1-like isoform X1 [Lupinus angustifolius]